MKPLFQVQCGRCARNCAVRMNQLEDGSLEASGYGCERGLGVAFAEVDRKRHKIVSFVQVEGTPRMLRVAVTKKIDAEVAPQVMEEIVAYVAHAPIKRKQVLIPSIAGTDANLIALETIKDASKAL